MLSHRTVPTILRPCCWLALALPASAGLLHQWDVGAAGATSTSWTDSAGTKNLAAATGAGGSTSVVFTDDSRVSLGRAYQATAANLHAGAASGLPTGSYTFEWWLHFGGAVTAGEVIFESGGGANGIGLWTNSGGLEFANASVNSGSDALAAVPLAALDLSHYVQVTGVCNTATNTLTLTVTDVNGVTASNSAVSPQPIGLGTGNGMGLFAGGNGNFGNVAGNIGGSGATGATLPVTPGVFSGKIALFNIWDGVDLPATTASYGSIVLEPNRADDSRPNMIVVFTDDHGYADLGVQGQDPDISALTPNIDRLATEGVRFTAGYITAPQCVPSRAGILSGRYQQEFGVDQNGKGPMPHDVVTFAERLRTAGYRTGMTGKWHLEPNQSDVEWRTAEGYPDWASVPAAVRWSFLPDQQGFEEFAEGYTNTYWKNFERDQSDGPPLGVRQAETGHRLDIQSDFAVSFIERNKDRPFVFYLSYYAPHVPLTWVDRYNNASFYPGLPENRRIALSMIKAIDDGMQRILAALDTHGIDDKTILWFIGDNGAPLGFHEAGNVGATDAAGAWDGSLNTPWTGEKGMLAEGGIRVPFLMRWAGTVAPQVYDHPVISLDVAATANAVAGLPDSPELDGVNLVPHLTGADTTPPHDRLFWRFWDQGAVREGKWKYLEPSASTPPMLFDLESDDHELENLIGKRPDVAADLDAKLEAWKSGLQRPGDLGPGLNNQEKPWYRRHFGVGLGYEFNTAGNTEGWTPAGVTNPRVEAGQWKGETTAGSSITQQDFASKEDFLVVGATVDRVLVKLRAPVAGTLELRWAHRDDDTFDAARSVSLPVSASPDAQWLAFPMEDEPEWNGEIVTRVRFLFSSSSGQDLAIDWIRASDGDFDRDGIDDLDEGATDTDGDGDPNFDDTDADGDSLNDQQEGEGDPDGDMIGNFLDTDSDNDRQSDRLESLLGTSPLLAGDKMTVEIAMNGADPEVTAVPGKTGLIYRFCRSFNLLPGSWVCLEEREVTTDGDVVFDDTPGAGETEGFYRVEVMEPDLPTPTLLAYDPFPTGGLPAEYDLGNSAAQAPSTVIGFDGGWGSGDATIESSGLTFTGLPASGGSIRVTDSINGGNQNNTRLFDQTYDHGTCYLSFLLRANRTSGAFQAVVRLQLGGADLARLGVQNGNLGLADASGAWAGTTIPYDALEHLLVAKLQIDPLGDDTIDLFVDPVPGDPEPASPFASLTGEFAFDGFRLFNNPGSATETILEVDEIRLGTGWDDAVPTTGS